MSGSKRTDALGHPMASWDLHPACKACLSMIGRTCSRSSPCSICSSWTEQQWSLRESADLRAAYKRRKRQEVAAAKAAERHSLGGGSKPEASRATVAPTPALTGDTRRVLMSMPPPNTPVVPKAIRSSPSVAPVSQSEFSLLKTEVFKRINDGQRQQQEALNGLQSSLARLEASLAARPSTFSSRPTSVSSEGSVISEISRKRSISSVGSPTASPPCQSRIRTVETHESVSEPVRFRPDQFSPGMFSDAELSQAGDGPASSSGATGPATQEVRPDQPEMPPGLRPQGPAPSHLSGDPSMSAFEAVAARTPDSPRLPDAGLPWPDSETGSLGTLLAPTLPSASSAPGAGSSLMSMPRDPLSLADYLPPPPPVSPIPWSGVQEQAEAMLDKWASILQPQVPAASQEAAVPAANEHPASTAKQPASVPSATEVREPSPVPSGVSEPAAPSTTQESSEVSPGGSRPAGAESSSGSLDDLGLSEIPSPISSRGASPCRWDFDSEEEDPPERFLKTRNTREGETRMLDFLSKRQEGNQHADSESVSEDPAKKPGVFKRNLETMWEALKPIVGSPVKHQTGKAKALSTDPTSVSSTQAQLAPLSPYLDARVRDLSASLKRVSTDRGGEATEGPPKPLALGKLLPNLKAKMGWYRVPRASFDFNHSLPNSVVQDVGKRERDYVAVPVGHLQRLERDSRAATLIGSFLDTSGATASQVVNEALEVGGLPPKIEAAFSVLADLERSRGQAVEHLLAQVTLMDANIKLVRRSDLVSQLELQPHLAQAAYQLPFDASGAFLFGDGLKEILQLGEEFLTKKHTRTVEKALVKAIAKPVGKPTTQSKPRSHSAPRPKKAKGKERDPSPAESVQQSPARGRKNSNSESRKARKGGQSS